MNLTQAHAVNSPLRWRVAPAFDDYVRNRTGDGIVTLSEGASRDEDGCYYFPADEPSSDAQDLRFQGAVEFRAYLGVLSVRIAQPSLHLRPGIMSMHIADDAGPTGTRLELATATIEPGTVREVTLDLRLTERGSELFLGKYPVGAPLAPLSIVLPSAVGTAMTGRIL